MASNLPSSFSRTGAQPPAYQPPAQAKPPEQPASPTGHLTLLVAIIALALSLASFYGAYFADKPLSAYQKQQLSGIANDLRALQNRQVTFSTPVSTTIQLNRSYPIKDLFPDNFDIPLSFNIPIDTKLLAISPTGQPVQFTVEENVPIKVTIPINSLDAFGNSTIRIQKELPVETKFSSTISVRMAYGQDINKIIDEIDNLVGQPAG